VGEPIRSRPVGWRRSAALHRWETLLYSWVGCAANGAAGGSSSGATVVWFKQDLRVDDHPGLAAAAARGTGCVCVFVVDEQCLPCAPPQLLVTALQALRRSLCEAGGELVVRVGAAEVELPLLCAQVSCLSTAGGIPPLGYPAGRVVLVELPLDSWWYPTAGVPGWACGVSGAASRQLVVPHRWGYSAGRVGTPASPGRPPREGEAAQMGLG
jgi:hypothetical protein